jgi:hypothetical protein
MWTPSIYRSWRRRRAYPDSPFEPGSGVDDATELPLRPIFVGGTGRSGTTITGRLLGAHASYHMIGTEVRFITGSGGLCDLAADRTDFDTFAGRLLEKWYVRGPRKGLHVVVAREVIEGLLPSLRDELAGDRWVAARTFAHRLLDPIAVAHGASGWVEMTPENVRRPSGLLRLFPTARLVHSVRDGRDVACSVARMTWGPSDPVEALDWWANELEFAFRSCQVLPADRIHVVQMEDLTINDRERTYGALLAFLELDEDASQREFFATVMTPDRAHIGRWRSDIPPDRLQAFEARYRRLESDLRRHGRPYHPGEPAGVSTAG